MGRANSLVGQLEVNALVWPHCPSAVTTYPQTLVHYIDYSSLKLIPSPKSKNPNHKIIIQITREEFLWDESSILIQFMSFIRPTIIIRPTKSLVSKVKNRLGV